MAFLSTQVFERRLTELRQVLTDNNLDAAAFFGADFFQFYSNFHVDVRTWERPIACIVPLDGAPFMLMNELSTHHFKMALERGSIWIEDAVFYYEHPRPGDHARYTHEFPSILADHLRRRGLGDARIGYDSGGPLITAAAEEAGGITTRPLQDTFRRLRWVKHPEELALMRQAAELSDWAQERYRENIRPGRLVQELDRRMTALMVEEAARRFPGENLEVLTCYTLSGPASASPHGNGAQTGAVIEAGDVLVNIIVPRLNGCVVENERTWFCGPPSGEQERLFETARAANEAAIAAAVTGRPVSGIDAAARSVIETAGYKDHILHRTGHGMGLIGHEFPEDMAFNERPLLADEVYSAEPGIYVYGIGGFRFDDSVVVGETPEVMTQAPKDLKSQTIV